MSDIGKYLIFVVSQLVLYAQVEITPEQIVYLIVASDPDIKRFIK